MKTYIKNNLLRDFDFANNVKVLSNSVKLEKYSECEVA